MFQVMEGVMPDTKNASASVARDDSSLGELRKTNPLMAVIVVIAFVVALLALIIIFVFASHQQDSQNTANNNQTTTQQSSQDTASTKTEGTVGPIDVNDTLLYNRTNNALGEKGPASKSSITGAEISLPTSSTPEPGY
jgi:FlaG/FlaF family flagellin (archaellin)